MIPPEEIVSCVLAGQVARNRMAFSVGFGKLHKVFYEAKDRFPEAMESFDFEVHTHPYSPTLDSVLWQLQQARLFGLDLEQSGREMQYRIFHPERFSEGQIKYSKEVKGVVEYICDKLRK